MKYYILYQDQNHGPLELEELEEYDLNPNSRVWAPGWASWQDAGEVPEIMEYINMRETRAREEREAKIRAEQEAKALKEKQEAKARMEAEKAKESARQNHTDTQRDDLPQTEKEPEWFYAINNQQLGPVNEATLRTAGIKPDTLVWRESIGPNWVRASSVPALKDLFTQETSKTAYNNPATSVARTISTGNVTTQYIGADPNGRTSSPYLSGIIGIVCAVIAGIMCFVKGEYLDGDELAITLSILALPAVILGVASLLIARHKINEPALGVDETAATRCGISIGLGIGAIVCALVGIIIAGLDFAII